MSDFRSALVAGGLRPRDVIPDGKIRRCATEAQPKKRNGWYVWHAAGHGVWGDWSTGSSLPTGRWNDESAEHAPRPDLERRMQAQRERERAERRAGISRARDIWRRARPLHSPHGYIAGKGLSPLGCAGLRVLDGLLVVPMVSRGSMLSVQTIDAQGTKKFAWQAPTRGTYHLIDRPRAAVTVIAEGLATGLAIFQSLRMSRVIVAFNAGNILPVVDALRPTGSVVIAADNDWGTQARRGFNPGIQAAQNAAELIDCGVWWPEGIEGTDAADYLREVGTGAARQLERQILSKARMVRKQEVASI